MYLMFWYMGSATPWGQSELAAHEAQGALPEDDHVDPATQETDSSLFAANTIRPYPVGLVVDKRSSAVGRG